MVRVNEDGNKSHFLLILLNCGRLIIVGPVFQVLKVSLGDVLERGKQVLFKLNISSYPPQTEPINPFLTKRVHSLRRTSRVAPEAFVNA